MGHTTATSRIGLVIRWIARTGSIASAALLMMFVFGVGEQLPNPFELVGLFFFPIGILVGLAVGWKNELLGGCITAFSLIAFYAFEWLTAHFFPTGPWFLIFASPGILFLVAWFTDRFCCQSQATSLSSR